MGRIGLKGRESGMRIWDEGNERKKFKRMVWLMRKWSLGEGSSAWMLNLEVWLRMQESDGQNRIFAQNVADKRGRCPRTCSFDPVEYEPTVGECT